MILIAQGRVITLVRPRKHSIHPSGTLAVSISHVPCLMLYTDLHILVNTIHVPSILNSSASASWLPICLPKFNPSAFVNAYVTFMKPGNEPDSVAPSPSPSTSGSLRGDTDDASQHDEGETEGTHVSESSERPLTSHANPVQIGLVCVSGQADFEAVRSWCTSVTEVRVYFRVFECILISW